MKKALNNEGFFHFRYFFYRPAIVMRNLPAHATAQVQDGMAIEFLELRGGILGA
ncbi:hypothetical protein HZA73_03250 [candidate division TA06 bacterium]|nr:hypothetical protein [candidate division TA06 bacterium]